MSASGCTAGNADQGRAYPARRDRQPAVCRRRHATDASKAEREAEAGITVLALLAVEFLGAGQQSDVEADCIAPKERRTRRQVADERLFVDMLTRCKRIAVEKDIVRDGATFGAGEDVPAEWLGHACLVEPIGAR